MPSTSSLVMSSTRPVPTTRPFFITVTRSARSNTSWMSWLMRKMPMPSDFSCLMSSPTCAVSCGPERRRRLVHDQDPGVEMDRARDGDRLALAAGQRDFTGSLKRRKFGLRRPITLRASASIEASSSVPQRRAAARGRDRGCAAASTLSASASV